MRTLIFALSWLVCAGIFALPGLAAEPHPFNARDLQGMHRLSDPQPSPQGDSVVFVLRSTDFAANRGRTHLVRVGLEGGDLTPLTAGDSSESSPRFTVDGKSLYFLSSRGGSSQVWRLDHPASAAASASPVQVTHLPLDVGSYRLAPDGRHLVASRSSSTARPSPAPRSGSTSARPRASPAASSTTRSSSVTGTPGRTAPARTSSP